MSNARVVRALLVIAALILPTYAALAAERPTGAPPVYLPAVSSTVSPLPTFPYAAAMRDGFKHEADQPNMPHYDLLIQVDPVSKRLNGHAEIWFRNTTGAPLGDAVLRLYPNFPQDFDGAGGNTSMTISNLQAQQRAVAVRYEAQNTAVRVPLPAPVAPGAIVLLAFDWTSNFSTFNPQDRSWPLPSYYPMLAAWQSGWRTDVSQFPDRVYANSGVYHARVTVPGGWTAISTGSNLGTTTNADGSVTIEAVSGPVREWAFSVGRFASVSAEQDGVTLVVWYEQTSGLGNAARSALEDLKRSLITFNQLYGSYPYRALETQLVFDTVNATYGVEYPGLIHLITDGNYTASTRRTLQHETGHQWYYGVLGNDIFNEAWLDEGFAQYSPYLVEAQWYGQANADAYWQYVERVASGTSLPAGLPVWEYGNWSTYHSAVYGKDAKFLHTLRGRIGDAAFFGALQDLYGQRRYGVIGKADVLRVMEAHSGQDLDALFQQWLGR